MHVTPYTEMETISIYLTLHSAVALLTGFDQQNAAESDAEAVNLICN